MLNKKIDIILVTGFLGAGKTTLLNRLIERYKSKKLGVIINDFGKISVDGILLRDLLPDSQNNSIIEIKNGSIFCSCLSADLVTALKEYIELNPDLLIIETSGLSDPSSFQKILKENRVQKYFNLLSSVCLIDPINVIKLAKSLTAIEKQIASSSIHIINKIDKLNNEQLSEVREFIKKYNSTANIIETKFAQFDLDIIEKQIVDNLNVTAIMNSISLCKNPNSIILDQQKISLDSLNSFFKSISDKIYRLKGFVKINSTLFYISSNNEDLEIKEYNESENIELGLSVLLPSEYTNVIRDIWKGINMSLKKS